MPINNPVATYGNIEGLIKNVLMGSGATQQDPNGRFYVDGQAVNVELSRAIVEAIYLEELFQPGVNCTAEYTTDTSGAGAVRILLDTLFRPSSRTLSYGGRKGTPGNSGVFDANPPVMPTTDEILLYLNQVNTQDIIFADLAKEYIPLNIMTSKIKGYGQSVAQDRTASTLAEVIGNCIYRALNDGQNIVSGFDGTQENAYANLISQLNALFTNGDPITGAMQFPVEGRVIFLRPSGYNIFNRNSGVILNGSNLAQEMLRDFDLSKNMSERRYVSQYYIGEFGRLHFFIVPDAIWTMAEAYLGLAAGSLNGLQGVAYSASSLAVGRAVDLGVKLQDSNPPYPRGIMARPVNLWGHEMIRKGYLIGDSTFTLDYLGTTLNIPNDAKLYPIAPADLGTVLFGENKAATVDKPVFGEDGSVIGFKRVAKGQYPSGDNWKSGMPHAADVVASVPGGSYTSTQSVTLTSATSGADIYYTTDGTTPTKESNKYSAAVSIASTSTLKAIAVKEGYAPSNVTTESYTITSG